MDQKCRDERSYRRGSRDGTVRNRQGRGGGPGGPGGPGWWCGERRGSSRGGGLHHYLHLHPLVAMANDAAVEVVSAGCGEGDGVLSSCVFQALARGAA